MTWSNARKTKAIAEFNKMVKKGFTKRKAIKIVSAKSGISAGTLDRWVFPRRAAGKNNVKTNKNLIKTQEAAAKYLGVSQRVISYHVGRGNLKCEPDGTFLKSELDQWAVEHSKRKNYGKSKKYTELQKKYDAEFRKARAEEKKLIVAQLRGKLISLADIESAWASRVERVTAGLEQLVNRLPPLLVGKDRREIAKILADEIFELRKQYAKRGKYCPTKN
jgi:hypothetical protein